MGLAAQTCQSHPRSPAQIASPPVPVSTESVKVSDSNMQMQTWLNITVTDCSCSLARTEAYWHDALASQASHNLSALVEENCTYICKNSIDGSRFRLLQRSDLVEHTKAQTLDGSQLALRQCRAELDAPPFQHPKGSCHDHCITCSTSTHNDALCHDKSWGTDHRQCVASTPAPDVAFEQLCTSQLDAVTEGTQKW